MTAVEHARVGDVLALQRRPVTIDPDKEYVEIGVRSFGRGVFHKHPMEGASLGRKRVFAVEPGDLVISNVFAWEGAIALASDAESGLIGSHRFMTFVPVDDRIDTSWAAWFFQSEPGLELIRRASPGSAGRNRTLAIERFESLDIPLPPIDEQRRVARKLDDVRALIDQTNDAERKAQLFDAAALEACIWSVIAEGVASGWPMRPLNEVAEVNPPRDRLEADEKVRFVPMSAVDALTGTVVGAEERRAGSVRSGYKQFREGDVIFARITPCMQNGKSAIFSDGGHAFGSTEFHVIRPGPATCADWVHRFLRTRQFRDFAKARMTGTAGQQRVPAAVLRDAQIPVPPPSVQREVVERIDELVAVSVQLHEQRAHARKLAQAILPSAINEAFEQLQ